MAAFGYRHIVRFARIIIRKKLRLNKNNRRRIKFIFSIAKKASKDHQWVLSLEQKALKKSPGWKESFDAFILGLYCTNNLSKEQKNHIQNLTDRCIEAEPTRKVIMLFMWVTMIPIATLMGIEAHINEYWNTAFYLTLFFLSYYLISSNSSVKKSAKENKWAGMLAISQSAFLITFFIAGITTITTSTLALSYKFYKDSVTNFENTDDFRYVKNFAKKNYHIHLRLDESPHSWAFTTLGLPGASVSFMSIAPGYCKLSLNREEIFSRYGSGNDTEPSIWLRGVMMHELGHCLDVHKDYPNFHSPTINTYSIPPKLSAHVIDLDSLLKVQDFSSTRLWREAYADIFTVGYWRISSPNKWMELSDQLKENRTKNKYDSSHSTACWIGNAINSNPPKSLSGLPKWASHIRMTAPCKLPSDQE